jgi:cytidyltransferase-like protein
LHREYKGISEHSDVFVVSDREHKGISEHSDVFVVSDREHKGISEHSDVFVVSDRVVVMIKVMVFGTFDGIHEGHRAFFREARSRGDYLIAVLAPDAIVERLKGKRPLLNISRRLEELAKEDGVDEVVVGDAELGTWGVVKKYRPEVIALGYDQTALRENLEAHLKDFDWRPEIMVMRAYEPQKYKSSLIGKR